MTAPPFVDVKLSRHALAAMRARAIEPEDVGDVLRDPELTEPHEGAVRYVRGPLCAVVGITDGVAHVITVLLRDADAWTDVDCRNRFRRNATA